MNTVECIALCETEIVINQDKSIDNVKLVIKLITDNKDW